MNKHHIDLGSNIEHIEQTLGTEPQKCIRLESHGLHAASRELYDLGIGLVFCQSL